MASSVPVVDLGKKRKHEESNNDAVSQHSDCESDSDSDFACEAPDGGNTCSTRSGKRLKSGIRPFTYLKSSSGVCVSATKEEASSERAAKNPLTTNTPLSPNGVPEASANVLNIEFPDRPMVKDPSIEGSVEISAGGLQISGCLDQSESGSAREEETKIASDEEEAAQIECKTDIEEEEAAQIECETDIEEEEAAQIECETDIKEEEAAQIECETDSDAEEAAQVEEDDPTNSSASVTLSSDTGVQRSGPQRRTIKDGVSFEPVETWSPLMADSVAQRTRMRLNAWVVGHSYIREASILIRYEQSLLAPGGMDFHWIGVRDLSIVDLRAVILYNLKVRKLPPPDYLVIHVGGNDLVALGHMVLRCRIINELQAIQRLFPEVSLFWSEIIYRRNWESEDTPGSCNAAIRNLNANVRALACALPRLQIIRHSVLYDEYSEEFFHEDGVHLSQAGTRLFISTIVGAVRLASLSSENAD